MRIVKVVSAMLAALALSACGSATVAPGQLVQVVVGGRVNAVAVAVTAIQSVALKVDGTALPAPVPVVNGAFGPVTLSIAPGSHTVEATATGGGGTYSASATVNATFGGSNVVTLYLFDTRQTQAFQTVPIVESIGAAPATLVVESGAPVPTSTLSSKVYDFDAATSVTVAWTDSCGGTFSDATAGAPIYTPPASTGLSTRSCTLTLRATAQTPNGAVTDPLFSVGSVVVMVTYQEPFRIDGYLVTAPEFSGANLVFPGPTACPLAWIANGAGVQNVALSADACAAELYGAPYPPGRPITMQALFTPPPGPVGGVAVSAAGVAECDGYGQFTATGTVAADLASASFTWPAGAVTSPTACKMEITVTFAATGTSTPASVSATLPVSFLFKGPVVVFDAIPASVPPNLPSQPFQAQQVFELGDLVTLAGSARAPLSMTILMSSWARQSDWPAVGDATGFDHPITVSFYAVDGTGPVPQKGALIGSTTRTVHIPWRPENDPTCSTPATHRFGWRAVRRQLLQRQGVAGRHRPVGHQRRPPLHRHLRHRLQHADLRRRAHRPRTARTTR